MLAIALFVRAARLRDAHGMKFLTTLCRLHTAERIWCYKRAEMIRDIGVTSEDKTVLVSFQNGKIIIERKISHDKGL